MLHALTRHKAAALVQATWSATNKGTDITFPYSDLIIIGTSSATNGGTVVSNTGKSTGKYHVECLYFSAVGGPGAGGAIAMGLHIGTSGLNGYLGGDTSGFSTFVVGAASKNRSTYYNGVVTNTISPGTPALRDSAAIEVDVAAGKLWIMHWSTTSWIGGGNPELGTSPTYTFTPGATVYFAGCPRQSANQLSLTAPTAWALPRSPSFGVWT